MSRRNSFFSLGLILLLAISIATGAWAQTSRGTVSGTITDTSGAVVANADVQLVQLETNVVRDTKSNEAGLYRFDAVALGTYKLLVRATGFASTEVTGVDVRANQVSEQDFTLKVGSGNETVDVSAAAAAIALQTDDQLRGATIDEKKLTQLPISGLNSLNLMLTVPGITPTRTGNGGGIGAVNGSRARANKFLIDGADNNDVSVAGQAITMNNNDAIQEVSIQTANFSAEFGRSGGAIVNQITKSGTNNLHGTANWIYDGSPLNASTQSQRISYFGKLKAGTANPVLKPKNHDAILSFTGGGPVYIPGVYNGKDKTFWFVGGFWDHYTSNGSTYSFTVPTAAGLTTLQSYAASCPNVALYLKALGGMVASNKTGTLNLGVPTSVYTANRTCNGDQRAGVTMDYGTGSRVVPNSTKFYEVQFRLDHTISSRQNISARVYEDNQMEPLYDAGLAPSFDANGTFHSWNTAIAHTFAITPTLTNELRVNYTQTTYWFGAVTEDGLGALPTFSIGTLSGFGTNANYPQGRIPNTYQAQDVVTKVVGRHQFRMGWEYFRQIARQFAPANLRGSLVYSNSGSSSSGTLVDAFANFMDDYTGWGTTTRVARSYGSAEYHPTYTSVAGFFQDSWKVTQDLTLNLGLRWDYFGQPANIFTYPAVNFDPAGFSKARVAADNNNFGPSVGFAWNPKHGMLVGEGKTVLRGGFQISYDGSFNNLLSNMATGAPNNPANLSIFPPSTGRGLAGNYATLFPAMTPQAFATTVSTTSQFLPKTPSPYTERWSFGFQRELPAGMIVDLSYVGSVSHHLNQQQELNPFGAPVQNTTTGVWSNGTRLIPTIGGRMVRANAANSNYNAMQLEVKKRYSTTPVGSILLTSAYTWSKSLGVVDDVFATTAGTSVYMSANPLRYNGWRTSDYGPSDNDRRHIFVTSAVWDMPSKVKMPVLSQILNGWTVSGNVFVRSGVPFSVFNGADRDLDGTAANDRPDIGNMKAPLNSAAQYVSSSVCATNWQTLYGTGCVTPSDVRFLYYPTGTYAPFVAGKQMQKNSLYTPMFLSSDASIIKTFKVAEGKSLEYRLEMFDVANSQNYTFTPLNNNLATMFTSKDKVTGMPSATFLDYSQSATSNRTMRMGLKFIF